MHGSIRAKWAAQGWERGPLGYPTSDESPNHDIRNAGRYNRFQKGHLSWTPATGANPHQNGTNYVVRLESFFISSLRSAHRDSDYVTLQVNVDGTVHGPTTVNMGDVATGNHTLDLSFPIQVDNPDSQITITYGIVNSGHQNSQELESTLNTTITKLAQQAGLPVPGTNPMQELGGDATQAVEGNANDTAFWGEGRHRRADRRDRPAVRQLRRPGGRPRQPVQRGGLHRRVAKRHHLGQHRRAPHRYVSGVGLGPWVRGELVV